MLEHADAAFLGSRTAGSADPGPPGSGSGGNPRLDGPPIVAAPWTETALLLASGDVADRIGADLTGLGYRVIAGSPGAVSDGSGSPPVVVLVSVDPTGERARAVSATLRGTRPGERVPVVWLVERDRLDALSGNEALFDEFVELPTTSGLLAARLRFLRHRHGVEGPEVLRRGPVRLHLATYRASVDGRQIDLTGKEFEVLRFLMLDAGRVFSRPVILDRIWGHDYDGGMRTVDIHVWRLRAKLGERGGLIETVRGIGYRFSRLTP